MNKVAPNTKQSIKLSGLSGYDPKGSALYAVPSNYLSVVNVDYYFPTSVQSGVQANRTSNRRPNAVDLLYSTDGQTEYNSSSSDYYNITT